MAVKPQNRSNAVMATRATLANGGDPHDDYPTPPWATRALMTHIIEPELGSVADMIAYEPACGRGYMSQALRERFRRVHASDIQPLGGGAVIDFLNPCEILDVGRPHWIITNPPFKLAEEFAYRAFARAKFGVALLVRTVFIESTGRWKRLFSYYPPTYVAQFSERVPMFRGRISATGSTATAYAWLVWANVDINVRAPVRPLFRAAGVGMPHGSELLWIPPCRANLERDGDYDTKFLTAKAERDCAE